jgi:hypothetical protein
VTLDGASLFAGIATGSVGMGFCIFGKRQKDLAALAVGIALCVLSYFIDAASAQLAVAGGIVLVFWIGRKRGLF